MPLIDEPDPPPPLLLRRARLWSRPEAPITPPQDLLLRDGRIQQISEVALDAGPDVAAPVGAAPRVLDLGGRIVTAGFWNCHVHLTEPVWRARGAQALALQQEALEDMLLSRGFVGAVDLSSIPWITSALIERIVRGELRGPRILTAAGGIRPPRGIQYYIREDVPWYLRPLMPMPRTPAAARRAVARQLRRGARVIKLFTGSYVTPDRVRVMRTEVARAAVEAAHEAGAVVFAHPSDRAGTAVAIEAGVDVLAHVPDLPSGTATMLARAAAQGRSLVPTLHLFASTGPQDPAYQEPIRAALRGFRAAGGRVLFGTDVGFLPDRDTAPELAAMAACGMTPADLLSSLTTEPAAVLGLPGTGTIGPGEPADLVVLERTEGPPTAEDLARIHRVIRGGRVLWSA
ncbi:amidohydrolase family protein [Brachybacterium hainanense]|uniref:Amidohydrolase family protein n=1 Tax=Brachybacterium hainanense TaxID=1541174 RepID=A0ABV6R9U9_9MICO